MRYEMTKEQAEHMIELLEKAEANGMKFQGFSFGDGKYYGKDLLYHIRDKGGFVMQTEPLTMEDHIVVVPNNGLCYFPDNSYMGMVKATARESRNLHARRSEIRR